MEDKHIIIILLVVIVIIAVAIDIMLLHPSQTKEPTNVKITSEKEQYTGGELSIKLTDLNKTPLSNEIVNITVTNKNGKVVVDDVVKTNSKGNGKLDLDLKKGKYTVNVSYGGNENYTGDNTTQKLTIKEKAKKAKVTSSSSDSSSSSQPSDWVDSEGNPHYYENGQEYVGTREGQHMTIEKDNYVRKYGMR